MNALSNPNDNPSRRDVLFVASGLLAAALLAGCRPQGSFDSGMQPSPESSPSYSSSSPNGENIEPGSPLPSTETVPWNISFDSLPEGPLTGPLWHFEEGTMVSRWNNEAQRYTSDTRNARIENGTLVIEAHREKQPYCEPDDPSQCYDWTSARIDSRGARLGSAAISEGFSFRKGELTASIKMPRGKGVWPAFWLLSANQPHTTALKPSGTDWETPRFYMHDGEIDIAEFYGNLPGMVEATAHAFNQSSEYSVTIPDASEEFHEYGIRITDDSLTWTLDGSPYFTLTKNSDNPADWPFGGDNAYYFILNLAMGGTGGGDIEPNIDSARMEIRSISFTPAS